MTQHIEEFASQLRELKERSGRSYGMLATRLHVSTSTLHRYCNGAAVPGDYAPVERFARQCGASTEELVALHQRWLLAAAAKRREPHRAADARRSHLPPLQTESADLPPGEGPPPRLRLGGAASGEVPPVHVPPGDAVPVHVPPGDAAPVHAPPGDRNTVEAPSAGVPVAPPHPAAADAPPDLPDVAHTPAAGGRRPGRRLRRTTVALAAVAALAAVLPLVLRSGHGTGDAGAAAPLQLPRPTASAPERPSPSASGRTHAPAGAGASAAAKPPLQVTVLTNNWDTQCGQWFLLGQQPAKVPPPPSLQEGSAWAAALGGIPAGHLRLQLTAQGLPGAPVVLHALYVKVLSSAAAPKGNVYSPADGCGGGIDPASFAVDLDTAAPRARAVPGSVDGGDRTATVDFPFRISASEPQVLDIDGHTLDRDVRWYMDLVWSCGARQGTLRIDDHGSPFRTVGMKDRPMYAWSSTRWYQAPPGSE